MVKAGKQERLDFIISCLENGEERGKILVKAGKKWGMSKSAFDRHLKIAKEQHAIKQQSIKSKIAEIDEQAAIDARKKAIFTADERKEYLTKIIIGEVEVPYKEIKWDPSQKKFVTINFVELAGHAARISAIAELNKMDGEYTPIKISQTNKDGEDVEISTPSKIIVITGNSGELSIMEDE